MEKTAILFSVLLLGWTWTLQGVADDDDQVDGDTDGATVNTAEDNTAEHDATGHSRTLDNAADAALIRAPFSATKICVKAPETGPCKAYKVRYFSNSTSKSCEKFVYGGCGGNRNNFNNEKECLQKCHTKDVCDKAPERGTSMCLAYIKRYFYNSTSMSCETFIYGGCGGNQNNFKDEKACMQRCHTEEVCNAAPETGPCKAHFEHYFYNSTSKSCETFIYGGCGGNRNNFKDEKACTQRCHPQEICNAAPETGPCKAHFEHYFYNSTSMNCEKFIYGGCLGNQNNFQDETECMQRCHPEEEEHLKAA